MDINYLTPEMAIYIHDKILEETGGLEGLRDKERLYSSIELPKMQFSGKDLYPSLVEKAFCYFFHIIENHPFNDGNKRTAIMCLLVFFDINCTEETEIDDKLLEYLAVWVASSQSSFSDLLIKVEELDEDLWLAMIADRAEIENEGRPLISLKELK